MKLAASLVTIDRVNERALALLGSLVLLGCLQKDPAKTKAKVDTFLAEMSAVRAALPKEGADTPCALTLAKKVAPDQTKFQTLYVIDAEQLAVLTQGAPGVARPDANKAWRFANSPLFFTTTDKIQAPLTPAALGAIAEEVKYYDTDPYVAVLATKTKTMPQAAANGFAPGVFEGSLVIFDRASKTPKCHAHLTATNSDAVKVKALRVGFVKLPIDEQKSVVNDFKTRLKEAAESTARKMTNGQFGLAFPGVDPG